MNPYSIHYDPATSTLEARVEGFWDQATIARFIGDFSAAIAELRGRGLRFGVLGDGSHFAVQAQEIARGLTTLVDAGNQHNRAPTAIVAGAALVKMQATRAMAAPHLRVFATRDEARAWLADQIRPAD